MRQIRFENAEFVVSGDPEKLLAGIIRQALTPPIADDLDERLAPGGPGLSLTDALHTTPLASTTDLGEDAADLEEPWVIRRDKPSPQLMYVEGAELRRLVRLGRKLAGL